MTTKSQSPVGTITVLVEKSARDLFFDQLKKFAEKHAFAIRIAPIRPDGEHFAVDMWRTDIKIFGDNPFDSVDPAEFRIDLYENSPQPVPAEQLNFLVNDLKRFMGEVRGVTLQVPKK